MKSQKDEVASQEVTKNTKKTKVHKTKSCKKYEKYRKDEVTWPTSATISSCHVLPAVARHYCGKWARDHSDWLDVF